MSNTGKKKFEPIVFMNMPVSDETSDIIGIDTAIASVEYAIEHDAKMIGLIADYGTGKSSLTDSLSQNKAKYKKCIKINMWDSLADKQSSKSADSTKESISLLTKSFLFQVASGLSPREASYVNKRLSKNYSIISFSLSSLSFWLFASLAALFFTVYSIIDNTTVYALRNFASYLGIGAKSANNLANTIFLLNPVFLILSIIFIVLGLNKTIIAFSNWKNQNSRDLEINDVFDSYIHLFRKLATRNKGFLFWKSKRNLIIIEDLDRVEERDIIVGFLKELYRFNNTTIKTNKHRPIFIVSVKDEHKLITDKQNTANDIYAKIFDYTISLKPINYLDYNQLVFAIIGEQRSYLNELLEAPERIIDNKLPHSFNWILEGQNLTIRQLKDRLNHAVALLATLRNKQYKNQYYINFASCAATSYLMFQYPKEYAEIIKAEAEMGGLVQEAYRMKNFSKDADQQDELQKIIKTLPNVGKNEKFIKDLSKMLTQRDIDSDFRMYFYSFPKGSYIKNSDEKDISNLLLLPGEFSEDSELDGKINRILKLENGGAKIFEIISDIGANVNFEVYPSIILKNEFLLKSAFACNLNKVNLRFRKSLSWEADDTTTYKNTIIEVWAYDFPGKDRIWKTYFKWLLSEFSNYTAEKVISIRSCLIQALGKDILICAELFTQVMKIAPTQVNPIISKEELNLLNNINIGVQLISESKISNDNFEYIAKALSPQRYKLKKHTYKLAHKLFSHAKDNLDADLVGPLILEFLTQNKAVDEELFEYVINGVDDELITPKEICRYVNLVAMRPLPDKYYSLIDALAIDTGLNDAFLGTLVEKKLFLTVMASYARSGQLEKLSFIAQTNIELILNFYEKLNELHPELAQDIRKYIISKNNILVSKDSLYRSLLFLPYPVITSEELLLITNFSILLNCIDIEQITFDNCLGFVHFFNSRTLNADECFELFNTLFGTEDFEGITDSSITKEMVGAFDYSKIKFSEMTMAQKESVVEAIGDDLNLGNWTEATQFMEKVNCLIESLEELVVSRNRAKTEYLPLVNKINSPTAFTMNWVWENTVDFGLADSITDKLLEAKEWAKYLVGKVLFVETFNFPFNAVPDDIVVEHYCTTSPIFEYIKENQDFLQYLVDIEAFLDFEDTSSAVLEPLYIVVQTYNLTQYLFSKLTDYQKIDYLSSINEIKSAEDSKNIAALLLKDENINLLEDDDLFDHVKGRLWEDVPSSYRGYKSNFTRKRNERFAV